MYKILSILIVLILSGCARDKAQNANYFGTNISGTGITNELTLNDHFGHERQLSDFVGKSLVVVFGYTHCPDMCPTTMADMAKAMRLLGDQADQVQVVFITLDPERDTKKILAEYVPSFDGHFIGLYGHPNQTVDIAKHFKVFYEKQSSATRSSYTIDHGAGSYVYDKTGKIRIYFKYGQKPVEIASDIKQIL